MEVQLFWYPVRPAVDKDEYKHALNTEDLAKILHYINRGTDANAWNCSGKTPLMIASEKGDLEAVKSLPFLGFK